MGRMESKPGGVDVKAFKSGQVDLTMEFEDRIGSLQLQVSWLRLTMLWLRFD